MHPVIDNGVCWTMWHAISVRAAMQSWSALLTLSKVQHSILGWTWYSRNSSRLTQRWCNIVSTWPAYAAHAYCAAPVSNNSGTTTSPTVCSNARFFRSIRRLENSRVHTVNHGSPYTPAASSAWTPNQSVNVLSSRARGAGLASTLTWCSCSALGFSRGREGQVGLGSTLVVSLSVLGHFSIGLGKALNLGGSRRSRRCELLH